jgi:hypothetical protein
MGWPQPAASAEEDFISLAVIPSHFWRGALPLLPVTVMPIIKVEGRWAIHIRTNRHQRITETRPGSKAEAQRQADAAQDHPRDMLLARATM